MDESMDALVFKIKRWGEMHDLHDPKAQLNKCLEELGEVAHEISRNKINGNPDLIDAIGDTTVTLIILSNICGYKFKECLEAAYEEIAMRSGKTEEGTFIKD